jgi:oxygen-dependent protoporphyrinogen oxidase
MTRRAVVVGAGITGLTAAYELKQRMPELDVRVVESRDRVGGNIVTERHEGFVLDGGPDSFLRTKPEAAELCRELGLESQLISPRSEARRVFFVHRGRLEEMPAGMALAVPTRLGPMLKTPLLSWPAKLRVLGDFFKGPGSGGDESIHDFIARRFGAQATERLAAPLLGGIYAGDISELSILSTFPQLVQLEQRHGSLIRGFLSMQLADTQSGAPSWPTLVKGWLKAPVDAAQSPFLSLRGGMGTLVGTLATRVGPSNIQLSQGVRAITRAGDGYRVRLDGGELLEADAVILAAPAHAAAQMVPSERLATELSGVPYLSTATVFFALCQADVACPLDGVGFVVPKGQARILAGTWVSSKWEARAPEGSALVRAFLGGSRGGVDVKTASDAELTEVARAELTRLMGPLGTARFTRVFRYIDANPQPVVGHAARLERIELELGRLPRLSVCGAAYRGVGIPDCVRQGRAAAAAVAESFAS